MCDHDEGCTGGKTGSTNQAKYCLAVSAKRNNTSNIAVVLGAENSKDRFKLASDLLNHGFNNFETITIFGNNDLKDKNIHIKGSDKTVNIKAEKEFSLVVEKGTRPNYGLKFNLPNQLSQAVENQPIGNVEIIVDGVVQETINILSCDTFAQATIWDYFKKLISMS
jgi:D-alanyl-D-alanine carboxypeptidase (penicillin-binding protein 5/6)